WLLRRPCSYPSLRPVVSRLLVELVPVRQDFRPVDLLVPVVRRYFLDGDGDRLFGRVGDGDEVFHDGSGDLCLLLLSPPRQKLHDDVRHSPTMGTSNFIA